MPRTVRLLALPVLLVSLAGAFWLASRLVLRDELPQSGSNERLQTDFSPAEVFARALWRPPAPGDRIVHALRREWSDSEGVTRWQSFLVLDPGPALRAWLATDPFSLVTVPTISPPLASPPLWFPQNLTDATIQQARLGEMVLITLPETSRIYLASAGRGFARPASIPPTPHPVTHPANRLPSAPPPHDTPPHKPGQ